VHHFFAGRLSPTPVHSLRVRLVLSRNHLTFLRIEFRNVQVGDRTEYGHIDRKPTNSISHTRGKAEGMILRVVGLIPIVRGHGPNGTVGLGSPGQHVPLCINRRQIKKGGSGREERHGCRPYAKRVALSVPLDQYRTPILTGADVIYRSRYCEYLTNY
jgi:hypothetical protein